MAKTPKTKTATGNTSVKLFTFEVTLIAGLVDEDFLEKNPVISRTIQMRGDQTLEDLHNAIFIAMDRDDEHMWEFQFGKKPMDRRAIRYTVPDLPPSPFDDNGAKPGDFPIDDLNLRSRQVFYYWFDFGDDWWHKIKVKKIEDFDGTGKYPKVVAQVGKSLPQYPGFEDEE